MKKIINGLLALFSGVCLLYCLWVVLALTSIGSFHVPSDSMEPSLLPGDCILVNKWVVGGRWFSEENGKVKISRLPKIGKIERNDVLVFNFPYSRGWRKIDMDMNVYYVKRCVGIPGDMLSIDNGFYRIKGCKDPVGDMESQKRLSVLLADTARARMNGVVVDSYPFHDSLRWTIKDFGPFIVPHKGTNIRMTGKNRILYRNLIEWETGSDLNDSMKKYTFTHDYYFMAGDKGVNSKDSRYWGLLPDDCIVGRAELIWKSKDEISDKWRWNRCMRRVR